MAKPGSEPHCRHLANLSPVLLQPVALGPVGTMADGHKPVPRWARTAAGAGLRAGDGRVEPSWRDVAQAKKVKILLCQHGAVGVRRDWLLSFEIRMLFTAHLAAK
eukprot:7378670-Prymnesium_polylepis.2